MFCIVCSTWITKPIPCGLCASCKTKEDARYVEPEIPDASVVKVKRRGRHKGNQPTNPITLYLWEQGTSLKEWCRENNEKYNETAAVIGRSKINKRLRRKLEEQGLWELLLEAENGKEEID